MVMISPFSFFVFYLPFSCFLYRSDGVFFRDPVLSFRAYAVTFHLGRGRASRPLA